MTNLSELSTYDQENIENKSKLAAIISRNVANEKGLPQNAIDTAQAVAIGNVVSAELEKY